MSESTTTKTTTNTPTKEHKRVSSFLSSKSISTFVSNASSFISSTNKKEKNSSKNELNDENYETSQFGNYDLVMANYKGPKAVKNALLTKAKNKKKKEKNELRNGYSSVGNLQFLNGK